MKAQSFLFLVAAAGVGFAAAVPKGGEAEPVAPARLNEQRPSRPNPWMKDDVRASTIASGPVWLSRESDGHFYADVTVDGTPSRMLVDTGASVIALTRADAQDMGVYWHENDVKPIGEGASGTVYGVPVTLERVQLGSLEVRDVQAVVVPDGLSISLLG